MNGFIQNPAVFNTLVYLVIVLIFVGLYIWGAFNNFIKEINQIKEDFSDILIQLKRRGSLIDQLISIVKQYSEHEKSTFEDVAKARSMLDTSTSVKETAQAENMISQTMKSLFAVVENYPKLQAQENYKSLMTSLEDTENRIAEYREEYNHSVQRYNNSVQTFPTLLVAGLFSFLPEDYYQTETKAIN